MAVPLRRSLVLPLLAVAGALVLLSGCRNQSQSQTAASAPAAPSPWKMTLAFSPDPPVADKETAIRVRLTDDAGLAVAGAQVKASLVMTTMDMGKNELTLTDQGGGTYQASAKFTMSGPWNAVVAATAGGQSGQQTFPVVVHAQ